VHNKNREAFTGTKAGLEWRQSEVSQAHESKIKRNADTNMGTQSQNLKQRIETEEKA